MIFSKLFKFFKIKYHQICRHPVFCDHHFEMKVILRKVLVWFLVYTVTVQTCTETFEFRRKLNPSSSWEICLLTLTFLVLWNLCFIVNNSCPLERFPGMCFSSWLFWCTVASFSLSLRLVIRRRKQTIFKTEIVVILLKKNEHNHLPMME